MNQVLELQLCVFVLFVSFEFIVVCAFVLFVGFEFIVATGVILGGSTKNAVFLDIEWNHFAFFRKYLPKLSKILVKHSVILSL